MRIRSIKPEFWREGLIPDYSPQEWKQFGPAPVGRVFLYRFFNEVGSLLYVGITWNPWDRWRVHRKEKPWWPEVTSYDLHLCEDDRHARDWETWCIKNLDPKYNKHQNRRWHQNGTDQDYQA